MKILPFTLILLLALSISQAELILSHIGDTDPLLEGWTLDQSAGASY